jgi:hypothetical protein
MSTITNTKSLSKNLRQIAAIAEDLRQKVNEDQGKSNEEPMKGVVMPLYFRHEVLFRQSC